ncbi:MULTISPECIES: ABC transporter substrate-binding protein [Clostridium]|jgi:NitT/TauT family transport system substrate-binding protein|uniref:ABC transporter substrate-binding protein n=1 Tax=Clostridium TaxID=1485 RepID=UPI000665DDA1|nr:MULTISPECIES: ABC transporter substrate-binding protein [Clostridium]MDB2092790.1 ABC transporter substrate-binding protein [Clostridium paraputrificum]MDB2116411.1 ABC transporter substrate-binding protein [Clostridium paraputrificum]MDU3411129.1 ABC transporter substrate-binding protein [Clostridium sp.]
MKNLKGWIVMLLVAVFSLTAIGCTSKGDLSKESEENRTLKIGLMPAVDTAPILIAEKNGYFKDAGINVEIEIYSNAQNRQSALQSYQIDGAMTDFIAVATNVDGGFDIKATTMTDGMFPVLSNGDISGKKDIKVGMMEVSVSNYLIDKWLGKDYNIEKVFINEIPARLAAIQSGELDMGLFPEPVASNGELKGLKKNLYGMDDEFSPDCLVFTGKAIAEKEKAIKAFHEAYNKAVDEINKNPQIARDILVEKIPNTNPEVKDIMVLPTYKKAAIPSDEYLQSIIDWTSKTLNKDLTVKPEALLEGKFVK